jgi:glutathione S-transferase
VRPRLYVIPASPPCACIEAALKLKRLPYDVTELPNVLHIPHQFLRFGVPTVPTMKLGDENVCTSPKILRRLDLLQPEPLLYPSAEVAAVEAWVVAELQPTTRRAVNRAAVRHNASVPSFFAQSRLPMPSPVIRAMAPVVTRVGALRNGATGANVAADLRALPGRLERLDAWFDDGILGGQTPNAADLQVGSNLALLLRLGDVAPIIRAHPRAADLADRLFPDYPGRVPAGVLDAA